MNRKTLSRLPEPLFFLLCLFTVTFFVYRDFGIRMIFGFGALGLLLAWNLLRRARLDKAPALDPLRLSFLVLTAAVFLNFLRPDSRHDADSVSFVIAAIICCAFVVLADPGEQEGRWALRICFGGGAFMAAFVLFFQCFPRLFWQGFFFSLSETAQLYLCNYVPRGYAITLGGCTYTNYILYLGISVGCAYIASRKFDRSSALTALLCAAFLTALVLVGRRGELLGALVCIVLLILAMCKPKLRRILIVTGLVGGIAAIAIIIPLLPWLRQFQPLIRYVMTIEQLLSGQDITSGRMELYTLAINAFRENPLFGIGWDQFHTLIPAEFLALHGQDVEDVHCIYLQFLTETGIVGAPFLIAPLLYSYFLICRQFHRLKHLDGLTTARMLCVSSFMIQSFLLFLGIYDPNFQRVVFWCFYAVAVLMQLTALRLEGHRPADPFSRLLERIIGFFAPVCRRIWNWVTKKRDLLAFTDWLLSILAFFACTFFFYRDFGSRMIYGYAALGLILALHLLRRLRRDEPLEFSPVSLGAALLAIVILFHFLLPGARRDVDTLSYQISMVICIACALLAPVRREHALRAGSVMHLGALAMAAFVVTFTLLPGLFLKVVYPLLSETAQRYYDFFAPLGYGVSLGTYSYTDYVLFLGAAVCCGDLTVKPRTTKRILLNALSLTALLIAIIVLGRRGELLAAAVAVLVLVLALCNRKKRRIILIAGSVLSALALTLVIAFLPQLAKVPVLARYVETVEQLLSGADITSGRGALMGVAVAGFFSRPLFGVGWGQYVRLSAQIGMCDTDGNLIEDCHNIYLQFLCETGIVGAVLILIPIVYLLYTTCRALRAAKYLEDKNALRFASISFLIQFFLLFLGLYDPSFQKIVFWCFYALAIGFLRAAAALIGPSTGPMSRLADKLTPAGKWIWKNLRRFVF